MPCEVLKPEDIFDCRQCGECCKGFGGTYVTDADIAAIAAFIQIDPGLFPERYCQPSGSRLVLSQGAGGYCVFWKDRICTIHPVKPRMCRAWPFIPGVLKDPGNWKIMAGSCPGIRADVPEADLMACIRKQIAGNASSQN